jgi:hypothetical protein
MLSILSGRLDYFQFWIMELPVQKPRFYAWIPFFGEKTLTIVLILPAFVDKISDLGWILRPFGLGAQQSGPSPCEMPKKARSLPVQKFLTKSPKNFRLPL